MKGSPDRHHSIRYLLVKRLADTPENTKRRGWHNDPMRKAIETRQRHHVGYYNTRRDALHDALKKATPEWEFTIVRSDETFTVLCSFDGESWEWTEIGRDVEEKHKEGGLADPSFARKLSVLKTTFQVEDGVGVQRWYEDDGTVFHVAHYELGEDGWKAPRLAT